MRSLLLCLYICLLILSSNQNIYSNTVVLYDGSFNTGTDTPDDQGWAYIPDPLFGGFASNTASGGITTLNTSAFSNIMAGYFSASHPLMTNIILDRNTGFSVDFRLKIISESHNSNDRAGFSIIALSSDLMGIELGFWTDQIWAQSDSPMFTRAESTSGFSATSFYNYSLEISGQNYNLSADNNLILTGNLRNYSSWTNQLGTHEPYDIPNFLFFGDDTSSAKSIASIEKIQISTIPEPISYLLFGMGIIYLLKKARLISGK